MLEEVQVDKEEEEYLLDFYWVFVIFMTSEQYNNAIDNSFLKLYQNMDKPLSNYFCNSSHNTYLSNDQLVGSSTIEAYVTAYRNGIRCIEVDSWDGPKGNPIITHGHTLTESILLEDFVKVTVTEGFKTSEYPIIISLENHCSKKQQDKIAELFSTHFGSRLITPELVEEKSMKAFELLGLHSEKIPPILRVKELPSPNKLKHKILIKASVGSNKQVTSRELSKLIYLRIESYLPDKNISNRNGNNEK